MTQGQYVAYFVAGKQASCQILFSNFTTLIFYLYASRRANLAKVQLTNKSDNYKKTALWGALDGKRGGEAAPGLRGDNWELVVNFVSFSLRMQIILQKLKADDKPKFCQHSTFNIFEIYPKS